MFKYLLVALILVSCITIQPATKECDCQCHKPQSLYEDHMPTDESPLIKENWLIMGTTNLKPWLGFIDTTLGKIRPDSSKLKDSIPFILHGNTSNILLIGQSSTPL